MRRARAGSAAEPRAACADRRPRRAAAEVRAGPGRCSGWDGSTRAERLGPPSVRAQPQGLPRPHRDPPRRSRSLHLVSPTARPGRSKGLNATLDQPTIPDHPLPRSRVQGTPGGKGAREGEGVGSTKTEARTVL